MTENHGETRDGRGGLIALNAALVAILAAVTLIPASGSSQPADPRGRGEYTVVGAKYVGSSSSAIVILDAQNQEMVALAWDESRGEFNPLGYRNLDEDARMQAPRNSGGGRK